jgi:hypothetical protein
MKTLAIIGNVVAFVFTAWVTVTDGFPDRAIYIIFLLGHLVVPAFTVFVLSRERADGGAITELERPAALANLALLAAIAWALVEQYPHPREEGFVWYVSVVILVPILNIVVLLRRRPARA